MSRRLELVQKLKRVGGYQIKIESLSKEANILGQEAEVLLLVTLTCFDSKNKKDSLTLLRYCEDRIKAIKDRMGVLSKERRALSKEVDEYLDGENIDKALSSLLDSNNICKN